MNRLVKTLNKNIDKKEKKLEKVDNDPKYNKKLMKLRDELLTLKAELVRIICENMEMYEIVDDKGNPATKEYLESLEIKELRIYIEEIMEDINSLIPEDEK